MNLRHNSPGSLKLFLGEQSLALSKRFGQNFLLNPGIWEAIVDLAEIRDHDRVWEIGPGLGALTHLLLTKTKTLYVFEIDRGLSRALTEIFAGWNNFNLITGDFLKTWKNAAQENGSPDRIIGNLPYNAASQILADLLEAGVHRIPMVFTVQKELAQRMLAEPGTKDYSSFTVLCRTYVTVKRCFDIQPGSFYPRPEVVSTVIKLSPGRDRDISDTSFYHGFVRALFASRRKILINNLCAAYALDAKRKEWTIKGLKGLGVDPNARGETLAVEQIVKCADNMRSILKRI